MPHSSSVVLLFATCLLWICSSGVSHARDPASMRRIQVVAPGFAADSPEARAFREGIRAAGYTDGRTVTIDWWFGHGDYGGVEEAVERALRTEPDVLVVESTVAALTAQRATQTIPIVMALVGDPEGVGLVETLARPGGNITGLTKQAVPSAKRVGVLWNPATPMHSIGLAYLKSVAPQMRIKLVPVAVRKAEQFESAFSAFARSKVEAVMGLDDPFMTLHGGEVVSLAARARLPLAYGWKPLVKEGILISYATQAVDLFRRAAGYVDKILRGASPATLPVEQPTKFELVINLRVAKALGLTVPEALIVQADEVIR